MPLGYLWYCTIEKSGIALGKRIIPKISERKSQSQRIQNA